MQQRIGFLSLLLFVLVGVTPSIQGSEYTVSTLGLESIKAKRIAFTDKGLSLDDKVLSYEELIGIQQTKPGIVWSDFVFGVLLQDGSWLPVDHIEGGEEDSLKVSGPFGELQLPLEIVAAWGDYEKLSESESVDALLLTTNNKPFGEVMGLSEGAVLLQTELSDEPISVPLEKISAARLRQQSYTLPKQYANVYTHPAKPPLRVKLGEKPSLLIAEDIALSAWDVCSKVQIMNKRISMLDAITPSKVNEKGLFDKVWHYALNANIDGSPVFLNGERYQHAVVLHSYAQLIWPLNKKYQRFRCHLGISDQLGREGNCVVRIFGDSKLLWSTQALRGGHKAHELDLDVSACESLIVEVDYGERYDIGDHVVLGGAYLLRAE